MYPHPEATWGPCLQTLEGRATSVAFSRDGLLASGSYDSTIRLWDPATGSLLCTLEGHSSYIGALAFSLYGNLASGSSDTTVCLWDPSTGSLLSTLRGHSDTVQAVAFSADGKLASGSYDKTLRIWDPTTGSLLSVFEGHSSSVSCLAFLIDGMLASGSYDRTVRLWDPATGSLLSTLEGHSASVTSIASMPDGLVSAGKDGTVRFWDTEKGVLLNLFRIDDDIGRGSCCLACSPEGTLAVALVKSLRLYNLSDGVFEALENNSCQTVTSELSSDSENAARASNEQAVHLYDQNQEKIRSLDGHTGEIEAIAFSSDGLQLVSCDTNGMIRLWVPHEGADESKSAVSDQVSLVAFSPNGKQLASSSMDSTVQLWDPVKGSLLRRLKGYSKPIRNIVFSSNCQQLASTSEDGTVRLWNSASGEVQAILKAELSFWAIILFSPDCAQLATWDNNDLQLWDTTTGEQRAKLKDFDPDAIAFSPNNNQLVGASADRYDYKCSYYKLSLWDCASGRPIKTCKDGFRGESRHKYLSLAIKYSPDGKLLASASDEETTLWDPIKLQKLHVFDTEGVEELSFSNDGSRLCTNRGVIRLSSASTCDASEQSIQRVWSLDEGWLLLNGENVLWIHPNYRPLWRGKGWARSRDRLALVHSSGRIFYLHFRSSILSIQPRVIATIDITSL